MEVTKMCGTLRGSPPPFCNWGEADLIETSVNKDWTCKDKDKDKDFTYSYLLQVAAKPTLSIKQQQWTQSESSQHMTVKPITLNK